MVTNVKKMYVKTHKNAAAKMIIMTNLPELYGFGEVLILDGMLLGGYDSSLDTA